MAWMRRRMMGRCVVRSARNRTEGLGGNGPEASFSAPDRWKSSLLCRKDHWQVLRATHWLETFMKLHSSVAAATLTAALLLALAPWAVATAEAQTTDPRVVDLIRAGKLRVGLFLPQYGKGLDGLKTTVWVETARAYAARVGVPLAIIEHATPPEAIACLKAGSCDQLFLPLDARAAEIGDFSNPIFQFDYTLMVPAGSVIAKVAEADRLGVRIAAVRNHASTNEVVRQVKQAEFVYAETPEQTFALVRDGKADVMASTRLVLLDFSAKLAGARVLADRYGANINRMVVPKGKSEWLAYVNEFVEEAKASSAVQQFIERGGTRGVTVAPLGNSN
jgi:polar amino acid transport system substrate-binding protein